MHRYRTILYLIVGISNSSSIQTIMISIIVEQITADYISFRFQNLEVKALRIQMNYLITVFDIPCICIHTYIHTYTYIHTL